MCKCDNKRVEDHLLSQVSLSESLFADFLSLSLIFSLLHTHWAKNEWDEDHLLWQVSLYPSSKFPDLSLSLSLSLTHTRTNVMRIIH